MRLVFLLFICFSFLYLFSGGRSYVQMRRRSPQKRGSQTKTNRRFGRELQFILPHSIALLHGIYFLLLAANSYSISLDYSSLQDAHGHSVLQLGRYGMLRWCHFHRFGQASPPKPTEQPRSRPQYRKYHVELVHR